MYGNIQDIEKVWEPGEEKPMIGNTYWENYTFQDCF